MLGFYHKKIDFETFVSTKPDIEILRREHPELRHLLVGEFNDAIDHIYGPRQEGTVASWILRQGKREFDPTYGRIPVGHYEFPITHTEIVHVLDGKLNAKVQIGNRTLEERTVLKGQKPIVAASPSKLILDVKDKPVYYFCQYM